MMMDRPNRYDFIVDAALANHKLPFVTDKMGKGDTLAQQLSFACLTGQKSKAWSDLEPLYVQPPSLSIQVIQLMWRRLKSKESFEAFEVYDHASSPHLALSNLNLVAQSNSSVTGAAGVAADSRVIPSSESKMSIVSEQSSRSKGSAKQRSSPPLSATKQRGSLRSSSGDSSSASDTLSQASSGLSTSADWKAPPLEFESRFECGNLLKAIRVGNTEYDLILRADTNCGLKMHTQWFLFAVEKAVTGLTYKFNFLNLEKTYSSFNSGMRPMVSCCCGEHGIEAY